MIIFHMYIGLFPFKYTQIAVLRIYVPQNCVTFLNSLKLTFHFYLYNVYCNM